MGGLVLTRKFGEAVVIGGDVTVRVLPADDGNSQRVRLHIDAPRETRILREEIALADGFEWVLWEPFVRDHADLQRGELALLAVPVRMRRVPGATGKVLGWTTFPSELDPLVTVEWDQGGEPSDRRASDLEWRVS